MNLNHTTNYQLSQWELTDRILMSDFNSDNSKIDAALKAHSDAIAGKAAQSTVNSLTQTVNTKANQSDLTALTDKSSAVEDRLDALESKTLPQKLGSVTVSSATDRMEVPLSGIDWGDWAQIHFLVTVKVYNLTPIEYCLGDYQIDRSCTDVHLIFYPVYTDTAEAAGLFLSTQGSSTVCSGLTYSELSALSMKSSDAPDKCILPGTKVEIWGIK